MQAVEAGKETHGKYVDAGKVAETSAFVRSEKGKEVQKKVWDELIEVLEGIEPGVSKNVA
jgi:retinol dehydrogenase-12